MILDERQLGVILQASLDRAGELLKEAGSFLPFGTRAGIGGEVEFLESEGRGGSPDALYDRIAGMLAQDARAGKILASALVGNASLPEGVEPGFDTAVAVLVEGAGFCRSIVVPYRLGRDGQRTAIEFGRMIPEAANPVVFGE